MNNVLIPKNWFVVGLIALVLVSLVFVPAVSASEPTHKICVEFAKGNIGVFNDLYLVGYTIKDCDGYIETNIYDYEHNILWIHSLREECFWASDYEVRNIDLSKSKLNCNEPFKKVVLYLVLERHWGYVGLCMRYDKITLDVTEYITSTEEGKNTFSFDAKQDYGWFEADRVDIFDLQGHRLVHFPKTDDRGWYGSFDLFTPNISVEFAKGNIGDNGLYFAGYAIKDCDGYIETNIDKVGYISWPSYYIKNIDLLKSKLNCNEPFKKVVLYLLLKRNWYSVFCTRYDKITLDVTEYITSAEKGKNIFSFDVEQDYTIGAADEIDIFDLQGNRLLHFPATDDEGEFGSFDPIS